MDVSASPRPPSIQGPTPAPESDLYSRTSSLSSRTLPLASHDRPSSSADKPIYPSGDLEKQQLASELNPALHQLPFSTTAPTKAAESDPFLVSASHPTYVPPTAIPVWRKWLAVLAIASGSFCVTCTSSMGSSTYDGLERDFGISRELAVVNITLFCAGLGVGPLLLGPLSEFIGRNWVYRGSFAAFILFTFPVAFANNAPVHLIFRFFTGCAGSAFLSVAGGTVSDLFENSKVGPPMSVYTASPFLGPIFGPLIGGFINQNTTWRWTYYFVIIWASFLLVFLVIFAPETHAPTLVRQHAIQLRRETGDDRYYAASERDDTSVSETIKKSVTTPFKILASEPMAFLLNLWTALILGLLYILFNGFPIVFRGNHGFNLQQAGLSFLGIGVGIVAGVLSQPIWRRLYERDCARSADGKAPPESRLYSGMLGAILCPLSLFLFAGTSMGSVHWIVPIIMSIPFGTGLVLVFTAVFTFLVDAYRPVAASAMAGNSFMRSSFAASFPLFATQIYYKLGAQGASSLLGGLLVLMAPLPFIFYRYGARIRKDSKFAAPSA